MLDNIIDDLKGEIVYPLKNWGDPQWKYLHTLGANYPNNPNSKDKEEAKYSLYHFVKNVQCLEPCRKNAIDYVRNNPPDLSSKQRFFDWTVKFHNDVNERLGKPIKRVVLRNDPELEEDVAVRRRSLRMSAVFPPSNQQQPSELDMRFNQSFPHYNDVIRDDVSIDDVVNRNDILQSQQSIQNPEIDRENVLSGLEGMYEPAKDIFGLKPQDLNLSISPHVLIGIIQNMVRSNMTPFGQFTTSLMGFITSLSVGVLMKDGISYGDRLLMTAIGAGFLSDTISNLDSKSRKNISEKGSKTIESLMALLSGNKEEGKDPIKDLQECFIETQEMLEKGEEEVDSLGLEAVVDQPITEIRDAQNLSQSTYDASGIGPVSTGFPASDTFSISAPITSTSNTLAPFVDNVKSIAVDQSQLDEIPIPRYLIPKQRRR